MTNDKHCAIDISSCRLLCMSYQSVIVTLNGNINVVIGVLSADFKQIKHVLFLRMTVVRFTSTLWLSFYVH